MTLLLPHSGSAAVAFCKRFPSPAIATWLADSIQPGTTVIDVGAHAGVYSLLAARLATGTGVVHAIEPQRDLLSLLMRSAEINHLTNIRGHCLALTGSDGTAGLSVDSRSAGAFTTTADDMPHHLVQTATLSSFADAEGLGSVGLMKLDAAGNEFAVLRGGAPLLARGAIQRIVCKLYHPDSIRERFGTGSGDSLATVELLRGWGYRLQLPDRAEPDRTHLRKIFDHGVYSVPLMASAPNG